ncbi:MAG: chemotaxis protein CheW [Oscillospiraceae bacterium]
MSFFDASIEPMLDIFVFEANTLLEQLDNIMLVSEKNNNLELENVNEIFRIMHTLKGSSAMMGITSMADLSHVAEDMFFIIRDKPTIIENDLSSVFDLIFAASDFYKSEVSLITNPGYSPSDSSKIVSEIKKYVDVLKSTDTCISPDTKTTKVNDTDCLHKEGYLSYKIMFDQNLGMENIRAFMILNSLKDVCEDLESNPKNPESNADACDYINQNGFVISFKNNNNLNEIIDIIESSLNVKTYEALDPFEKTVLEIESEESPLNKGFSNIPPAKIEVSDENCVVPQNKVNTVQSLISVKQNKLDELVDIVGEIVIAESMVTSNPDLKGLTLDNFYKASRQLRKLTDELQDIVMSIRMVPISGVFNKMQRVVRDVSKKLGKDVVLETIGDETEVDKTISDIISDPFMHMVRNALDHAIETPDERKNKCKVRQGTITLSAQNIGSEIVIQIIDDGKGLDHNLIYKKAIDKGIKLKPQNEYSEKEIFALIMHPGFSTKEEVTEFSGRGVGMDVVKKNIEKVNGNISVNSTLNVGTTFTIKIPLTLAIVDGMTFSVGSSVFTIPTTSIMQSFKVSEDTPILKDTDGLEMIMTRGECYPILRLHKLYEIDDSISNLSDGILIIIESTNKNICIFVDELIGEQQVVVKPFPTYLSKYNIKNYGLAGCAILGDGGISLILDANSLLEV